ncbi:MAG: superoxide dismutase [Aigarchaeota archaeon]|nr:superoxide dismutase [Aigarchaeota archaeon]MCX8193342.1 superoxide dismutase [Nitrososphaeria archaeon]MDW7985872.1 superoxide dismutase [Nitrososphaerota archaeon]
MPEERPRFYVLPSLPYSYNALEPYISEQQLTIHHQKHHQAYVTAANQILERLDKARKENADIDMRATLKALSFNIGGHLLHSLYWSNMAPAGKGGGKPGGVLADRIEKEFGSFERFKKELSDTAIGTEASGWAALTLCRQTDRLIPMQIEKHNTNVYPMFRILFVIDVFEHAYYIDYKNNRGEYVEKFWNIVNWDEVDKRLQQALK